MSFFLRAKGSGALGHGHITGGDLRINMGGFFKNPCRFIEKKVFGVPYHKSKFVDHGVPLPVPTGSGTGVLVGGGGGVYMGPNHAVGVSVGPHGGAIGVQING
jgi:hypothetical protein